MRQFVICSFICFYSIINFAQNKQFISNYNKWSFNFYKQIIQKHKNQVFSPYFTYNSASLLYFATKKGTFKQVAQTFGYDQNKKMQTEKLKQFINIINQNNSIYTKFNFTSVMLVEDSLKNKILPTYKQNINNLLNDTILPIDFTADKQQITDKINQYLKQKGIKEFFKTQYLQSQTALLIISAIEFQGLWQNPFTEKFSEPFILDHNGRKTKPIVFYTVNDYFEYTENKNFQIIELPYKGRQFALQIILPKKNYDIQDFDTTFTYDDYLLWTASMQTHRIRLIMPEFYIHCTFLLKDYLKNTMFSVFKPGGFFLNMIRKLIYLNNFITYSGVKIQCQQNNTKLLPNINLEKEAQQTGAIIMQINHPFFFLIKHKSSGAIIFMGHFYYPEQ